MFFTPWLSSFSRRIAQAHRRRRAVRPPQAQRQPGKRLATWIEAFEPRELLTDITVSAGGTLSAQPTTGDDVIVVQAGATLSGTLDAGMGSDVLNYSVESMFRNKAYSGPVRVNLSNAEATISEQGPSLSTLKIAQSSATGIKNQAAGGILNFEIVVGGTGDDVLYGFQDAASASANTLAGGRGNGRREAERFPVGPLQHVHPAGKM